MDAIATLSPREREIVRRLADGEPQKAIAAELGIAIGTVEVYTRRAREKVGARTVLHLVVIWTRAAVIGTTPQEVKRVECQGNP